MSIRSTTVSTKQHLRRKVRSQRLTPSERVRRQLRAIDETIGSGSVLDGRFDDSKVTVEDLE